MEKYANGHYFVIPFLMFGATVAQIRRFDTAGNWNGAHGAADMYKLRGQISERVLRIGSDTLPIADNFVLRCLQNSKIGQEMTLADQTRCFDLALPHRNDLLSPYALLLLFRDKVQNMTKRPKQERIDVAKLYGKILTEAMKCLPNDEWKSYYFLPGVRLGGKVGPSTLREMVAEHRFRYDLLEGIAFLWPRSLYLFSSQ